MLRMCDYISGLTTEAFLGSVFLHRQVHQLPSSLLRYYQTQLLCFLLKGFRSGLSSPHTCTVIGVL